MNRAFEEHVQNYFSTFEDNRIKEAMLYSFDGGKRFRPEIIFAIVKGFGLDETVAYDAALALEMIQTYSLIHDDLPAMDNDDLRRGKPTSHKQFGEDIAILTGDSLLTHSFGVIADSKCYTARQKVSMISYLSSLSGMNGMILGQLLDISSVGQSLDKAYLERMQDNKTGGLFKIACLFGMIISSRNDASLFTKLGSLIGILFQDQDDLFDVIRLSSEMGKSLSDSDHDKFTALSIYSVDELKVRIDNEFSMIEELIDMKDFNKEPLMALLNKLKNR